MFFIDCFWYSDKVSMFVHTCSVSVDYAGYGENQTTGLTETGACIPKKERKVYKLLTAAYNFISHWRPHVIIKE